MTYFRRVNSSDQTQGSPVRVWLGMSQMASATVAAVLLFETGVSVWTLAATVVTCVLTTLSVLLFGSRPPGGH